MAGRLTAELAVHHILWQVVDDCEQALVWIKQEISTYGGNHLQGCLLKVRGSLSYKVFVVTREGVPVDISRKMK